MTNTPKHIYVHVPFCSRRCSYCDFSIAVRKEVPWREYADGVAAELALRMNLTRTHAHNDADNHTRNHTDNHTEAGADSDTMDAHVLNNKVQTLYLGGGTPSHLGPSGLNALLDALHTHFSWDSGAEFTLEANPEDITPENVRHWQAAGVNRLSIGIQSFHDNVLEWMHRVHNAETAKRAINIARDGGISEHSIDLIFATPDNLQRSWERDISEAIALNVNHISIYGLTIEGKTPLGRWRERGEVREADDTRFESEYLLAHHTLASAGYEHYEVSNYARLGHRARHNSVYWRNSAWIGIGPAAHSFDGVVRRWNEPAYALWLRSLKEGRDPIGGSETLTEANKTAELVYLGLRTHDGLAIDEREAEHVRQWVDAGWVEICHLYHPDTGEKRGPVILKCTALGWLRLDSLAADLAAFRERS